MWPRPNGSGVPLVSSHKRINGVPGSSYPSPSYLDISINWNGGNGQEDGVAQLWKFTKTFINNTAYRQKVRLYNDATGALLGEKWLEPGKQWTFTSGTSQEKFGVREVWNSGVGDFEKVVYGTNGFNAWGDGTTFPQDNTGNSSTLPCLVSGG